MIQKQTPSRTLPYVIGTEGVTVAPSAVAGSLDPDYVISGYSLGMVIHTDLQDQIEKYSFGLVIPKDNQGTADIHLFEKIPDGKSPFAYGGNFTEFVSLVEYLILGHLGQKFAGTQPMKKPFRYTVTIDKLEQLREGAGCILPGDLDRNVAGYKYAQFRVIPRPIGCDLEIILSMDNDDAQAIMYSGDHGRFLEHWNGYINSNIFSIEGPVMGIRKIQITEEILKNIPDSVPDELWKHAQGYNYVVISFFHGEMTLTMHRGTDNSLSIYKGDRFVFNDIWKTAVKCYSPLPKQEIPKNDVFTILLADLPAGPIYGPPKEVYEQYKYLSLYLNNGRVTGELSNQVEQGENTRYYGGNPHSYKSCWDDLMSKVYKVYRNDGGEIQARTFRAADTTTYSLDAILQMAKVLRPDVSEEMVIKLLK